MNKSVRAARSVFAGLMLASLGIGAAQATTVVDKDVNVPGHMKLAVTGGCDNKGSNITLGPELGLIGIPVTVVFDGGGDHDQTRDVESVNLVLDLGEALVLPKQPVRGGLTGNPKISVYVGGELVLGPTRCNKL